MSVAIKDLPRGANPAPLKFPHFPTEWQAVLWRNWGLVPIDRIARVLRTNSATITAEAKALGLATPAPKAGLWPTRGYATILRKNWHLLPYEQLLELLNWSPARMAFALKEDDFLWHKLGDLKPAAAPVYYVPLTAAQKRATAEIRRQMQRYFPNTGGPVQPAFEFTQAFRQNTIADHHAALSRLALDLPPAADAATRRQVQTWAQRQNNSGGPQWQIHSKNPTGQKIILELQPQLKLAPGSHVIAHISHAIKIAAKDTAGLIGGLDFLAEHLRRHGTMKLPNGKITRQTRFDLRLVYPYYLLYGDPWNDPEFRPLPKGLLARYAQLGINGIWLQGILYQLVQLPETAGWCRGWEARQAALRRMVKEAAEFGIGVYLYLNEPRCMPLEFFKKHPEWQGVMHANGLWAGMCTSQPAVQNYLRASTAELFRAVPGLAGAFLITMSENLTNCWSKPSPDGKTSCPRCARRPAAEVVGEVNRIIAEGIFSTAPQAKVITWTWGWERIFNAKDAIKHLAPGTILMCTSEEDMPLEKGGISVRVNDYTISNPGPGIRARRQWRLAKACGLPTAAKVQINTSWECPAIPYLPALDLIEEHMNNLTRTPVRSLLLSWTLGGYPSLNLKFAARYYWQVKNKPKNKPASLLQQFLEEEFGPAAARLIRRATQHFSAAFREFPFAVKVLYLGPQNPGPANLLFSKPTSYRATMVGFPYDDLDGWRGPYPRHIFERQFRTLSMRWQKGLPLLQAARRAAIRASLPELADMERMAWGAWAHFRSAYLQVRYVRLRERLQHSCERECAKLRREIRRLLQEEIRLACRLHELAAQDSTIGFEATNHYAYSLQDLREKVLNCRHLIQEL